MKFAVYSDQNPHLINRNSNYLSANGFGNNAIAADFGFGYGGAAVSDGSGHVFMSDDAAQLVGGGGCLQECGGATLEGLAVDGVLRRLQGGGVLWGDRLRRQFARDVEDVAVHDGVRWPLWLLLAHDSSKLNKISTIKIL